ncbi:MAG: FG-GAP-like repeat-containing protein [Candidatus Acidiferrales bacterium]
MKAFRFFFWLFLVLPLLAFNASAQCVAPTCAKIIDNGPDTGKKVLVVMGDGYAAADQNKYDGDVYNLITNGMFANEFFAENHNAFSVYRLNLTSVDSGVSQRVYNGNTVVSTTMKNTALEYIWSGSWAHCWLEHSANTDTLKQNALNASVPNYEYVMVILNQDSYGGCNRGPQDIVTPRQVVWQVMAHESGHGMGGLMDEYSAVGPYTGGPVNGPNCSTVVDRTNVHWNRFISPTTALPTTFTGGMDSNRTVGMFDGCATNSSGIYRPVNNCRMNSNTPPYCPVCYTIMKGRLYPSLGQNFSDAVTGDFTGDGKRDVLIHNGDDIAIYRVNPTSSTLDLLWIANNIVPAAPGGNTWQPAPHDQYYVLDFDGDGKDDIVVFNGVDWVMPYLGLLRSTGTGLQGVARYDSSIPGFWQMTSGDKFFVADFNGDRKKDLFIFNGNNWAIPYLGMLRSNGNSLSGLARYDGSLPGWQMRPGDQFFAGDFDGDGKQDLYVFNGNNWSYKYLGMLKSSGASLSDVKLFTSGLPGWTMQTNDQFFVGDLDGDGKDDLYVFNPSNWAYAYLLMARSTGNNLSFVHRYDSSSAAANIPGWYMTRGDRFFISDANKDGKADLFVSNPKINWSFSYLGTLLSTGSSLTGSWSQEWVGGWHLGPADKILSTNYESGRGEADIYIRNNDWFGLLRRAPAGFVMDRIYYHWIYTALYDSTPWSDTMTP